MRFGKPILAAHALCVGLLAAREPRLPRLNLFARHVPGIEPPLAVPVGTRNLARGKPVTSSIPEPIIGEWEQLTDGDKSEDGFSRLHIDPGLQWAQIDLGEPCEVHAVAIWRHNMYELPVYRDVIVQVGNKADFTRNVVTVFNNDHDGSAGLGVGKDKEYVETQFGRVIPAGGVTARYVRVYSDVSYGDWGSNDYTEMEVHGRTAREVEAAKREVGSRTPQTPLWIEFLPPFWGPRKWRPAPAANLEPSGAALYSFSRRVGTQAPLCMATLAECAGVGMLRGVMQPLSVPRGTRNLALGKQVTSSERAPLVGRLQQITDGLKGSWEGAYVELGPRVQWVQIDLGEPCEVRAFAIWRHNPNSARVYQDVIIQASDTGDFAGDAETVFNNDHDNSAGFGAGEDKAYIETHFGRLIPIQKPVARFVRFYSDGSTADELNHYREIEVYEALNWPTRPLLPTSCKAV